MSVLLSCLALALDAAPAVSPEATPGPGFDLTLPAFAPPALEDAPPKLDTWTGAVTFGGSFSNGNTERSSFALTGKAEKRREKDRWTFEFLWNRVREDGALTDQRTIGTAKYDYFVNKKLYYLAQGSGEDDANARLHARWIIGGGVGYQFHEDEKWKVSGEAGLSWIDENYKGDDDDQSFLAARLAYNADYIASKKWSVGQSGALYPSLEDKDDVNARVDTHAKVTLTESLIGAIQWLYTWDNTPAAGTERVDNLLLLTLGWTF